MRTRRAVWLIAYAILISVLPGCSSDISSTPVERASFAIYRPSDHSLTYEEALQVNISRIALEPEPFISGAEIEWYSWFSHEFEVRSAARERLGELGKKLLDDCRSGLPWSDRLKPFVVAVAGNPRYLGVFYCCPIHSTIPPLGPNILPHNSSRVHYIIMGPDMQGAEDPRNDELVRESLNAAGVLR